MRIEKIIESESNTNIPVLGLINSIKSNKNPKIKIPFIRLYNDKKYPYTICVVLIDINEMNSEEFSDLIKL